MFPHVFTLPKARDYPLLAFVCQVAVENVGDRLLVLGNAVDLQAAGLIAETGGRQARMTEQHRKNTTPWAWDHTRPSISFDTFVLRKLGRGARNGLLQLPIAYFDLRSVCHRMNRCRPWKGKRSVSFNNGMWWESYLEYPWVALLFFRPAYPGCKRLIYIDIYWFILIYYVWGSPLHSRGGHALLHFGACRPRQPNSKSANCIWSILKHWNLAWNRLLYKCVGLTCQCSLRIVPLRSLQKRRKLQNQPAWFIVSMNFSHSLRPLIHFIVVGVVLPLF